MTQNLESLTGTSHVLFPFVSGLHLQVQLPNLCRPHSEIQIFTVGTRQLQGNVAEKRFGVRETVQVDGCAGGCGRISFH
ncbi:hypothetical protein ACFX2B_045683 [Malus domestica]